MSLIDKFWIRLFYQHVGSDQLGNNYYQARSKNHLGRQKRYVIYRGIEDGSKIPALWHAWLHYSLKEAPIIEENQNYSWQIPHLQNMTGSKLAYQHKPRKVQNSLSEQSWKPQ